MRKSLLAFVLSVVLAPLALAQVPAQSEDVMLQAFYWDSYDDSKWSNLLLQTNELANNFDLVWLPPSGNAQNGGMGYMPIWYFDQNSAFGSQTDLIKLVSELKSKATRTVADVVVNHRNGKSNWTDFPEETYNGLTYTPNSSWICSNDEVQYQTSQVKPTGALDTGDNFEGCRDLDHTNTAVQNNIKAYLHFLKNVIGYDGWRYDMTKGFTGSYVADYNDYVNAHMSVGEFYDGNYDLCWNWIKAANYKSMTFDFPLKFQINAAMSTGDMTKLVWTADGVNQPAGLIHHTQSRKYAVTFVDNHDTGRETSSKVSNNILGANAFILSSPGIPTVWLRHWLDNKSEISKMIAARKAAGIHSESSVTVNSATASLYVATSYGKNGNVIVKLGSVTYTPPAGYNLVSSGAAYAMYTNVAFNTPPVLTVSPESGAYAQGTNVTFTTEGGAEPVRVYYTLDGNTPTVNSTQVNSGASIFVNGNITVKAVAIDALGLISSVVIREYKSAQNYITVKWKNDLNWTGNMYLYSWNASGQLLDAWPGLLVTPNTEAWYSYTFAEDLVNVIFNNGSGNPQTVNIENLSADACYQILNTKTGTNYNVSAISCPDDTELDELKDDVALVYPVPTNNAIVYLKDSRQIKAVMLFDLSGREIFVENLKSSSVLNLQSISKGTYVLKLETNSGIQYQKIILQ